VAGGETEKILGKSDRRKTISGNSA
jgi:hypothetical protein